jgi:alpha-tubulin suppressor-like RCC1 family protein
MIDRLVPTRVQANVGFRELAGGPVHTCAISSEPQQYVYCWGNNYLGQLGIWSRTQSLTPQMVILRIDP